MNYFTPFFYTLLAKFYTLFTPFCEKSVKPFYTLGNIDKAISAVGKL